MSLFAIGDTHLSLGDPKKSMAIFPGWENYCELLQKRWNAVVTERDTVVLNGDISWAMQLSDCVPDFTFLNELNGKKIIIKGNHDYWWTTMAKMQAFLRENEFDTIDILNNNAFEVGDFVVCGTRGWFFDDAEAPDKKVLLREAGRLRTSIEAGIKTGKEPIVFLHYPPLSDTLVCHEIMDVLKEYSITRCYFGHLHNEKTDRFRDFYNDSIRFCLISSDFLRFRPKLIEKF